MSPTTRAAVRPIPLAAVDRRVLVEVRAAGVDPLDFMSAGDDVTGAENLVNCIVTVKRDGGHSFLGTLDLTKSRGLGQGAVGQLRDQVSNVPFTAWTEKGGQLGRLELDLTGVKPSQGRLKITYHSFGQPVDAQRPDPATITDSPSPQLAALVRA
ncbi:hypothetical protein ACI2K4_28845 [Micromonospora sp. NPDC050397]|uniref:hypothetical protein n=1 Tax=Micromonospora sp. NPDC050397 TaxID=3364279 RepID=UPI00384A9A0E